MPIVNRKEAGSLTLPRPATAPRSDTRNAEKEVMECGSNVLLMEARLCEMTSSIRALTESNDELEEALKDSPDDPDFLEAVEENKVTIRRQGKVAVSLVQAMKAQGADVDLEEDIKQFLTKVDLNVIVERPEPEGPAAGNNSSNDPTADAPAEGIYL